MRAIDWVLNARQTRGGRCLAIALSLVLAFSFINLVPGVGVAVADETGSAQAGGNNGGGQSGSVELAAASVDFENEAQSENEKSIDPQAADETVAKIGDQSYATLQAAFDAAKPNDTIVMQANVEGMTTADIVTVAADKVVTLDMAGHKITVSKDFAGRCINNNGVLTVTGNGTIDSSNGNDGYGTINSAGTLTIKNGTFRGNSETNTGNIRNYGKDSKLVIDGGTFDTSSTAVLNYDGTAILNGGTYTTHDHNCSSCGNNWAYVIRTYTDGAEGIAPKLYVNGGTYIGTQGALSSSTGYLEVNGGTFKTVNCKNSHGAIFYPIYAAGEYGKIKCVINGGTFENTGARPAVYLGNDNTNGDGGINADAISEINGGTFITQGDTAVTVSSNTAKASIIKGGTFSSLSEAAKKYLSPDMKVQENGGMIGIVSKYVASIGDQKYETLAEAVTNAKAGDTVVLLGDAELITKSGSKTAKYVSVQNSITIDLNGHTASGGYLWAYGPNANITIQDTSASKTGAISNIDSYGIRISGGDAATVNVTGGTITGAYGIYAQAGEACVSGGTISGTKNGAFMKNASLNVAGGTITGPTAVVMWGGTVTVSDNAFIEGGPYGISLQNTDETDASTAATLNMTGGRVYAYGQAICGNNQYSQGTTANISGGHIGATEINGEQKPCGTGIFWPMAGTLTISDNANVEADVGIEAKLGTININGGSIVATGEYQEYQPNGNGTVMSGNALALSAQHYGTVGVANVSPDLTVTITGGTFESRQGGAIEMIEMQKTDAKATLNIQGGFFNGKLFDLKTHVANDGDHSEDVIVNTVGGSFSHVVTDFCSEGYGMAQVGGSYTVHKHQEGSTVTKPATCTSEGEKTTGCIVEGCLGDKTTEAIAIDPSAHNWGEWTVVRPAAEGVAGIERRVCSHNASHVELRDIAALPVKPTTPDTPETPDKPNTPETPDKPDTPNIPDTPDTPDTPDNQNNQGGNQGNQQNNQSNQPGGAASNRPSYHPQAVPAQTPGNATGDGNNGEAIEDNATPLAQQDKTTTTSISDNKTPLAKSSGAEDDQSAFVWWPWALLAAAVALGAFLTVLFLRKKKNDGQSA